MTPIVLDYVGDPASTDLSATAQLLTAQSAVNDGEWFQAWSFRNISIQVENMNPGDKVELRGWSKKPEPPGTEQGYFIQQIRSDGEYVIVTPPKWIKLRKTVAAGSPGPVDAFFFGAARNQ